MRLFLLRGAPILLLIAAALQGCETSKFYLQAAVGQGAILWKSRPIGAVERDPRTSVEVKRKLALASEIRSFARGTLKLPAEGRYTRYTDLKRPYVSWVVFAAPEFSVEAKTWSYPLVGKLEYRGYFSERDAQEEGDRLKARGFEVCVDGVEAYSTLGWFHDPVLNTFLRRTDAEFAELLFHELTHVRIFLPGDTEFNEALATANAEAGVRRWLEARGDLTALKKYEATRARERKVVRLLLRTREKLKSVYASGEDPGQMRREKARVFDEMRQEYRKLSRRLPGDARRERAFAKPWNNARLNTVAAYYTLVPAFERLIAQTGNDPERFYAALSSLRKLGKAQRRLALDR